MIDLFVELGFNNTEIKDIISLNSEIIDYNVDYVRKNIDLLKEIDCTLEQIRNIIYSNPYFLDVDYQEIMLLIRSFMTIGIKELNLFFNSNPWILNISYDDIIKFIDNNSLNRLELCDLITSNPYILQEDINVYKVKKDLEKNIFRGYDIRGVYPTELDEDSVYTIGLGFGSYIKSIGKTTCVVGHDNRISSDSLYDALISGIKSTGINIVSLGLCTTPMYYYACIKLKIFSGIMVTASHNPKDNNGLKFAFDESGNCKGEEIQDFLNYILKGEFSKGNGKIFNYDIEPDYLELFKSNLKFGDRRVKVVIDPGNGTTSIIAEKLHKLFPIDLVVINGDSDGRFPNHHPDPCVEDNLSELKKKVLEVGADLGLGFDGDGDRMGLISNTGKFIPTDKYMVIFIRDIFDKVQKKEFLYDVKCSKCVKDEIEKLGGKGICSRTGNSYTKAAVRDMDLPFGGELSGHVYFRDRWPGFDSGLYAGLRMIELLSNTNKTVDELLEGINNYYSTPEIKITSSDNIKFNVVDKVLEYVKEKGYKYIDIDGVRVEFSDSWALVRASNTGPNLTLRFEATTKERLDEIQQEFMGVVNEYNK